MNLSDKAKNIILGNWKDGFSIPTDKLYPFQWKWDSGFVAMGSCHFDLEKSMQEINSMISGQWGNGMIPHILFHSENETSYFPNYDFWNSNVNKTAPTKPKSSGITQPPVFGFVLEELLIRFPDNKNLIDFVKAAFPHIVHYHKFLYEYRDPNDEGLFYIFHPWESGRDNSPIWDEPLNRIEINKAHLPKYERRDISIADASERPTSDQYDRYVYLLELGKKYNYDGKEIANESQFLIQDCMMNSILLRSNQSLINIANRFGYDTTQLSEWQALTKSNFSNKFWNENLGTFVSYDCRAKKQMPHKEIGGFVSLFSGSASKIQANRIKEYLENIHQRGYYLCPSFDVDSPLFDSKRYWRGPVWPQMNWLIYKGLSDYGFNDLARIVRSDLIELVELHGFYEYFESEKSKAKNLTKGYGGKNFSWTASTIVSFLNHDK